MHNRAAIAVIAARSLINFYKGVSYKYCTREPRFNEGPKRLTKYVCYNEISLYLGSFPLCYYYWRKE